jgi:CBS domain-containing protein
MRLKDISKMRGREILTTKPNSNIAEVIDKLVQNKIGALPVCELNGKLVGIISERDILTWIHGKNIDTVNAKVMDVMTKDVISGELEDNVEDIFKKMSEKGVRHLPIVTANVIVGMLSLRDVIEERLSECSSQVSYLSDYISGRV